MKRLFCFVMVFVSLFGLVGCGDNAEIDRFQFCEHVELQFTMAETGEVIFNKDNIISINTELYNTEYGYWSIIFQLDKQGSTRLKNATSAENKGKQINIIMSANGEDSIISVPTINEQVTNGKAQITTLLEWQAKTIVEQLGGKYCIYCNPDFWESFD